MDASAVLKPVSSAMFGPEDMRRLVRVMVSHNNVSDYNLTLSVGGINLTLINTVKNSHEIDFEIRGPQWSMVSTVTMDQGKLDYGSSGLWLKGDSLRFETDIIYLKMVLT